MEEQDVEIVEPTKENKEIAKVVGIQGVENPNQKVIINGQEVQSITYVLHCGVCGRVVYSFNQPGISLPDVIKIVENNIDNLLNIATYCPKCGHKISYGLGIIDGDFIEHQEGEVKEGENKE